MGKGPVILENHENSATLVGLFLASHRLRLYNKGDKIRFYDRACFPAGKDV
jgi:hypothetical protein